MHSKREQELIKIVVVPYFLICSVSVWKLNDDLFVSAHPYDANATGNVSTSSSPFVRAGQKKTHNSTFIYTVVVAAVFFCTFFLLS